LVEIAWTSSADTPRLSSESSKTVVRLISRRCNWSSNSVARCILIRLSHHTKSPGLFHFTVIVYRGCVLCAIKSRISRCPSSSGIPMTRLACEARNIVLRPSGPFCTSLWNAGALAVNSWFVTELYSFGAANFRECHKLMMTMYGKKFLDLGIYPYSCSKTIFVNCALVTSCKS